MVTENRTKFDDVSGVVVSGAQEVSKSLDTMVEAATKADIAQAKLSKTQLAALDINKRFRESLNEIRKGFDSVGASGIRAFRGMSAIGKNVDVFANVDSFLTKYSHSVREIEKSFENLKSISKDVASDINRDRDIKFERLNSGFPISRRRRKPIDENFYSFPEQEVPWSIKFSGKEEDFSGFVDEIATKLNEELEKLKELPDNFTTSFEKQEKDIFLKKITYLKLYWKELESAHKKQILAAKSSEELKDVLKNLSEERNNTGKTLKAFNDQGWDSLNEGYEKTTLFSFLKSLLSEGELEAKRFASGMGMLSSSMIAAGVAALYLLKKVSDLIELHQRAAISAFKYNVELGKTGKVISGGDAALESYRKQLNITRDNADTFFSVLQEGTASGLISTNQLVIAAKKLQEAYGGDQTQLLREYVDILKEIPTLDTDLKISASMDDRAATIFALAQSGKISTVMELQQAGLAGGEGVTVESEKDVEMLNAAQKTERWTEDINTFLVTKMFPSWGPQFYAIADYTFKTFSAIGAGFATTGVLMAFLNKKQDKTVEAVENVEKAIRETSGAGAIGGDGGSGSTLRNIKDYFLYKFGRTFISTFVNTFKTQGGGTRALMTAVGKATTTSLSGALPKSGRFVSGLFTGLSKNFKHIINPKQFGSVLIKNVLPGITKGFGSIWKGMKVGLRGFKSFARLGGGAAAIVGLVLTAAGKLADWLAGKLEKSGNQVDAAGSRLTGSVLSAAGTVASFAGLGAFIGSVIVPGIGTSVGALVGGIAGFANVLWNDTELISRNMTDFGEKLSEGVYVGDQLVHKYGPAMQNFGKWLKNTAPYVQAFGEEFKDNMKRVGGWFKTAGITVGKFSMKAIKLSSPIGWLAIGIEKLLGVTDEYRAAVAKHKAEIDKSKAVWKEATEKNKEVAKAAAELQQGMIKSGLSLERHMNAIGAVVESSKNKLADFRKEVSELDMKIFREIGGSAEQYDRALYESTSAVTDRFKGLSEGLRQRRIEIMKDGDMQASERRLALLKLHNEEMKAAKIFVEGINEVLDEIFHTPDRERKEKETKIRTEKIEFLKGSLGREEMFGEHRENIQSSIDNFLDGLKKIPEFEKKQQVIQKEIEEEERKSREEAIKAYGSLPNEVKKLLGTSFKTVKTETGIKATGINEEESKESLKRLREKNKELDEQINETAKIIGSLDWGSDFERLKPIQEDLDKLEIGRQKLERQRKRALKDPTKLEANQMALEAWKKQKKELDDNMASSREAILGKLEKQLGIDKQVSSVLLKIMLAGGKKVKLTKEEAQYEGAARKAFEKLVSTQGKAKAAYERQKYLLERSKATQHALSISESVMEGSLDKRNQAIEAQLKLQSELFGLAGSLNDQIEKINELHGAEIESAKRSLELREAELSMSIQSNDAINGINKVSEATIKTYKENYLTYLEQLELAYQTKRQIEKALETETNELAVALLKQELTGTEESIKEIMKGQSEITNGFVEIINSVEDKITQAMSTPLGQKIGFDLEFVTEQFDLSEISEAAMSSIGDMVELAKKSASARADIKREAVKLWEKTSKEAIDNLAQQHVDQLLASGKIKESEVEETRQIFVNSQLARVESEKQLKLAQLEKEEKQDGYSAVEKATRLQNDQLEAASKTIQAQLDLFDSFGGTANELSLLLDQELDNERKQLDLLKQQKNESQKLTGNSLQTKKLEAEIAEKEVGLRKKEFDNAKKVIDLRRREVEVQNEVLDAEMEMAMDFGHSLSTVIDIQQRQVSLARQQYELAKEEYELGVRTKKSGVELAELEKNMKLAQFKLTKQSMGVQRDIMEKMIGSALNAARSSVGARRRRGTDIGLLGIEGSRVKMRSGMFASAGTGGVKPYWARVAELQSGAKRLKTEELMQQGISKTADETAATSQNTGKLLLHATKVGSLYTHDVSSEMLLNSILYVAEQIAVGINDVVDSSESIDEKTQTKEKYRDLLKKGILDAQKQVRVGQKNDVVVEGVPGELPTKVGSETPSESQDPEIYQRLLQEKRDAMVQLEFAREELKSIMEGNMDYDASMAAKKWIKESEERVRDADEKIRKYEFKRDMLTQEDIKNIIERSRSLDFSYSGTPSMPLQDVKSVGGAKFDLTRTALSSGLQDVKTGLGGVGFVSEAVKPVVSAAASGLTETLSTARNMSAIGGGAGVMEAKPMFTGVRGGERSSSETPTSFKGEITVHFNSNMFQSQVTTIALKALNTQEGKRSIERGAFG